jgi:acyl CoA:acetate/3-ketoacid CoA transferase
MTTAKPILTPDQAALLIRNGVTVAIGGSGASHSIPERMLEAIGRRHRASGAPRELTLIHPFGVGDQGARGLEHMAMAGLYRRVIGGHWSMSPSMAKLAAQNLFEAYCLPAGILVQLFHSAASGSPGFISEIGLGTFIDPRVEGGKLNPRTVENLVELWNRDGKEYLYYRAHPIDGWSSAGRSPSAAASPSSSPRSGRLLSAARTPSPPARRCCMSPRRRCSV